MSRESGKQEPRLQDKNGDRLDSWKEISAYLRQGVRTVQRWETESGLPIYRPPGKRRGTVFAFRSELDTWWETQKNRVEDGSKPKATVSRARALAVVAALAAVLATGVLVFRVAEIKDAGNGGFYGENGVAALRFTRAAISPDARWLAYTDELQAHLRVRDLRNGDDRVLVAAWTAEFAWSRDSMRIAYSGGSEPPYSLAIVDVGSGEITPIAEDARLGTLFRPYDWSLDGEWILCTKFSPVGPGVTRTAQVGFVSVVDRSFVPFLKLDTAAHFVRLSPDDEMVAYSSLREGNLDIYVAPTDGSGEETRLTRHPDRDREPVWSPDGRYVLFDRRHGSDRDNSLWGVAIESKERISAQPPRRIADLGYDSPRFRKSFTPDGELLEARFETRTQCYLLEVDPKSGRPVGEPVSDFPELSSCLHWSKDGNRITYENFELGEESPAPVQVERDLDTGEERLITTPLADELTDSRIPNPPRNRPDYRWRFFVKRREPFIYRYDVETEETSVFYEAPAPLTGVAVSPNADYLSFRVSIPGPHRQFEVWLLRLSDMEARKVANTGLNPATSWSRDGSALAFADTNCLMVMAPEDPEPTRLTCTAPPNLPDAIGQWGPLLMRLWFVPLNAAWSPDGTKLAWTIPVPENHRVELWVIDRATGEHQVALAGEENYYTTLLAGGWSYDGRWLATDIHWYPDHEIEALPNVLAKLRESNGSTSLAQR